MTTKIVKHLHKEARQCERKAALALRDAAKCAQKGGADCEDRAAVHIADALMALGERRGFLNAAVDVEERANG